MKHAGHSSLVGQQQWWQGIRPVPALFSFGVHAAVLGIALWFSTQPPQPTSAAATRVVSVSLIQQQAVAVVDRQPEPAPPTTLPEAVAPTPKPAPPAPKPVAEPKPARKAEPPSRPPATAQQRVERPPLEVEAVQQQADAQEGVQEVEERLIEPVYQADYLHNPRPAYPRLSRRLKEQGEVVLRVLVSPEGAPRQVTLHRSSGHQRLDKAAVNAVERWQFIPARRGGRTVEAWVIVPIAFNLNG